MTLIVITAVPERIEVVTYLLEHLPGARVVWDQGKGAMDTFRRAWEAFPDQAQIKMQDDVLLTRNFVQKAEVFIDRYPDSVIQFFSRRGPDATVGSRWIAGGQWMMNQAHYLPPNMAGQLARFAETWDRYEEHPTGDDSLMADFFKKGRHKYFNVCPSLVDHLPLKSEIDPRRSKNRNSLTFTDPETRCLPEIV